MDLEPGTCNLENLQPGPGDETYSPRSPKRQPEEWAEKKASVKECGKKGKGKG